jgi:hypothetical protein
MTEASLYILFTSDAYYEYSGYTIAWSCRTPVGYMFLPCAAGKYSNTAGAIDPSTCVDCPYGKYSLSSSRNCSICPAGFYSPDTSSCFACPAGAYNAYSSAKSCSVCPSGKYSNAISAVSISICMDCDRGSFSEQGSNACSSCPKGSYSNSSAASTCTLCPPGKYTNSTGTVSLADCILCPSGGYCSSESAPQALHDR